MADLTFSSRLLKLQPRLLNFALILTGDRERAYNLLQDSTLSALEHAEEYTDDTSFDTWVRNLMRSEFVENYAEAAPSSRKKAIQLHGEAEAEIPQGALAADEMHSRIEVLAEPQRSIVKLWVVGYTADEIVTRLNVTRQSVRGAVRSFRV